LVKWYSPTFLEPLELWSVDVRFRTRRALPKASEFVALDYDDRAAREHQLGRWPWDRRVHAKVVKWLERAGARVIVLDVVFEFPSSQPGEDDAFASAVAAAGNVFVPLILSPRGNGDGTNATTLFNQGVLIDAIDGGGNGTMPQGKQITLPLPELVAGSTGLGHIVRSLDPDGILRRIPLLYAVKGGYLPALALAAAFRHMDVDPASVQILRGESISFKTRAGQHLSIPIDEQGRTWINYAGPWAQGFTHYPLSWLLSQVRSPADEQKLEKWFKDKTVVVSNLTTGSGDQGPVPFDNFFPFGEVHLHLMNMLMTGRFLRDGTSLEYGLSVGLPATALTFAGIAGGPGLLLPVFFAVVIGYAAVLYYAFAAGVILPAIYPFLTLVVALILVMIVRFFIIDRERYRFQTALGACLPPQTVQEIQRSPGRVSELLRSRRKELTVLFADIRGFTDYCQRSDPLEIQRILGAYLGSMTEILKARGGTIDKYMGDGIMAFFGDAEPEGGGPDQDEERVERHAAAAVQAGMDMQRKMAELNAKWESQGRETHLIRVGINTGPMTVGRMGTEHLWDYTVVGSEVNKGQRLETNAPAGGLLLARRTYALARKQGVVPELAPEGRTLKGLGEQTDLYPIPPELIGQISV